MVSAQPRKDTQKRGIRSVPGVRGRPSIDANKASNCAPMTVAGAGRNQTLSGSV